MYGVGAEGAKMRPRDEAAADEDDGEDDGDDDDDDDDDVYVDTIYKIQNCIYKQSCQREAEI